MAWPAILEMGLHMLVGVVDTAMVGRLGPTEIAGVALGSHVFFSVVFVFAAIGIGAASLVSRSVGARDHTEANRIAAQALALALGLGAVIAVAGYLVSGPLFVLSRTDLEVQQLAARYLQIIIGAAVFMLPQFVANALLRSAGDTRTPLFLAAVANVINIIGDYVLIFGLGPIKPMGVSGAALASAGAQIIGAVATLFLLFSGRLALRVPLRSLSSWDSGLIKRILRLSTPAALEELSFTINSLAMVFLIGRLGTVSLAAHQIALTVESISFMPGYGFAIAAATLTGQNLGAQDEEAAFSSGWLAVRYSLMVMGSMAAVFLFFPALLARLFSTDPTVVAVARDCIRIAAFQQIPVAIVQALAGSLRGAGDTRYPFFVSSMGNWAVRLPLVALAVLVFDCPIWSVWLISSIDWAVRAVFLINRFQGRRWAAIKV